MSDKQTYNHIPALRFPDFANDGEWEVKRLGNVCKLTNGMAFKPSDWRTTGVPIVRIQNLNDEKADFNYCDSEIIDEKCLIDSGTLLFSWSGTPGTSFGAYIWNRGKAVLNQHIFIVDPIGIDQVFLKMTLDANMAKIIEKSHGGAGLRHITKSDLEEIPIFVPNRLSEQQHIAVCLSAVDELLTSTNGKLEQLKTYKKGLIQKLFPAKGKKLPELRFKEFEKDGEWEEKKLGELLMEVKETTTDTNKIPLYSLTIDDGVTSKTERYERGFLVTKKDNVFKVVSPNDFVSNPMNLRFGAVGYNQNAFSVCVSGYYDVFRFKEDGTSVFWNNYLKSDLLLHKYDEIAIGSLIEKRRVYFSNLQNLKVFVPSVCEQRKIASCLSTMDDQINAYTEKVALLEQYKKGLMQRMFPQNQII